MACISYPTLLLWVAVLNTNMVKIKYARPKILADHLVGSRGQKWPAGHSLGITGVHCEQMSRSNGEAGRQSSSADRNVRSCARRRCCRRRWNPTRHARHPTYVYQPPHSLPWKLVYINVKAIVDCCPLASQIEYTPHRLIHAAV